MLKIYHAPGGRSIRPIWLCEEMGIPYETILMPFGKPRPQSFLDKFPLNAIPALEHENARMTESIAIMRYIIAKFGPTPLEVKSNEAEFGRYLEFLEFGESGVGAPVNAVVGTLFGAPADQKNNWTDQLVRDMLRKRMDFISANLKGREFIAANRFTAADISITFVVPALQTFGILGKQDDVIEDYIARMTARPGYQKAAIGAVEGLGGEG